MKRYKDIQVHFLVCLLLQLSVNSFSQDLNYARKVVNILASDAMKGRGYVANGNIEAAKYIASEFKAKGLKSFGKDFFQSFPMSVNTFPQKMEVSIHGKYLIPGQDYLVDAGSPSIAGTFNTVKLTVDDILKEGELMAKLSSASNKLIVVEPYDKKQYNIDENKQIDDALAFLKYSPANNTKGTIILTHEKLTWSTSTVQNTKPTIVIKTDIVLPVNISQITLKIKSKWIKKLESRNVIAYIEGKNKDSILLFTAHYDHLGMMGNKTIFPGANDNASGVALLLNLAQYYALNKPEYTMVFIAFGGEEAGLLGSKYFTETPLFALGKIKFLLNFDLAGTGDEGIQVVNGTIHKDKFNVLSKINEQNNLLPAVKIRGEACNSDHCSFTAKKVPCFFIYTLGGIKAYHDIYDKPDTLPFTEFEDYFKLIIAFVKELE